MKLSEIKVGGAYAYQPPDHSGYATRKPKIERVGVNELRPIKIGGDKTAKRVVIERESGEILTVEGKALVGLWADVADKIEAERRAEEEKERRDAEIEAESSALMARLEKAFPGCDPEFYGVGEWVGYGPRHGQVEDEARISLAITVSDVQAIIAYRERGKA